MIFLGLDIGMARTGCALADDRTGVPVALDTIRHDSAEALCDAVVSLAQDKKADLLIIGMPYLPSGEKGSQADFVEFSVKLLNGAGLQTQFIDERYSTPRGYGYDPDASAAVELLHTFLDRRS